MPINIVLAANAARGLTNDVKYGLTLIMRSVAGFALTALGVVMVGHLLDIYFGNHGDELRDSMLIILSIVWIFGQVVYVWRRSNVIDGSIALWAAGIARGRPAWQIPLNILLTMLIFEICFAVLYYFLPVEIHPILTLLAIVAFTGWLLAKIRNGSMSFNWNLVARPLLAVVGVIVVIFLIMAVTGYDVTKLPQVWKEGRRYTDLRGSAAKGASSNHVVSAPASTPSATLVSNERVGLLRASKVFEHGDDFSRVIFAGTEEEGVDSQICLKADEVATVTHKSGSVLVNPANGFFVPVWGIPHDQTDPYYDQRMMSPNVPSNGIAAIVGQDTVAFANGQHQITVKNQSSSDCEPVVIWINESAGDSPDNMGNLVLEIRKQ